MDIEYFLAVDGGGTKTHVWCATSDGKVVGEGFSGSTNLTAVSVGEASLNLAEGIRQATQSLAEGWRVQKMVIGLAGADTPAEIEMAQKVFQRSLAHLPIEKMVIVNDVIAALHSGSESKNAVAVVSGTGSNCFGQNEAGETAQVSGADFLLSDEGSGYAIGIATLRKAVQSFDGRIPKTLLESLIAAHFRVTSIAELKNVVYHPVLTKSEVASLSKICAEAFLQGDETAKNILENAVEELLLMVSTVVTKLHLKEAHYDCVLVGGVFEIEFLRNRIIEKIRAFSPNANVVLPEQPPVAGALRFALGGV